MKFAPDADGLTPVQQLSVCANPDVVAVQQMLPANGMAISGSPSQLSLQMQASVESITAEDNLIEHVEIHNASSDSDRTSDYDD